MDWEAGATGIVAALNARWGGRVDAGAQALEGLLAELEARGFIPEIQVGEALGCGSSLDELPGRLRSLDPACGIFMPGLGLCSPAFAEAMRRGLRRKPRPKPAA
jgi:hypothetical protein